QRPLRLTAVRRPLRRAPSQRPAARAAGSSADECGESAQARADRCRLHLQMDRTRWRGWRHTVPTEVAVLALLVLVASLCCLLGVLFPISDQAPVELGRVLTPIGFAVFAALLWAG